MPWWRMGHGSGTQRDGLLGGLILGELRASSGTDGELAHVVAACSSSFARIVFDTSKFEFIEGFESIYHSARRPGSSSYRATSGEQRAG